MFINGIKRWKQVAENQAEGYTYYRLCEAYRDKDGKPKRRIIMGHGTLDDFDDDERNELADVLTAMITKGEACINFNAHVREAAIMFYAQYRESERKAKAEERLREEAARRKAEWEREAVMVKLSSFHQKQARTIGAENVCLRTIKNLGIKSFLLKNGFSETQAKIAIMQIIARSIYPGSELRTVRCLQENSALCELLGINPQSVNKDTLYRSANKLWDVHKKMEDYLHNRVCDMFGLEEKIYLFDLTNVYFEGRMEDSALCQYGRSKEKRSDCKIVGLGAVVNTDGLLVRTEIFEGNRQDVSTLEGVIGSFASGTSEDKKKIIVMDAGFSSEKNLKWLRDNGYDYITVERSHGQTYSEHDDIKKTVHDNKQQEIHLQKVAIEGISDRYCLLTAMPRPKRNKACRRNPPKDMRMGFWPYRREYREKVLNNEIKYSKDSVALSRNILESPDCILSILNMMRKTELRT